MTNPDVHPALFCIESPDGKHHPDRESDGWYCSYCSGEILTPEEYDAALSGRAPAGEPAP